MSRLPGVRITEFAIEDYDSVVMLWNEAGLIIRPGDDLNGIRLKLQRDPDLFLLAREDHELIGSVLGGWDGRRGWIYHLAVKNSHRREGVAKALVRELESRLSRKGAKRINAQIYRSNVVSLRFFQALGYEERSELVMIGKALAKEPS